MACAAQQCLRTRRQQFISRFGEVGRETQMGRRRFPSASRHYAPIFGAWTNKERSSDRIGTSVHVQRRRSMHEGGTARSTRSSGRFRRTEARPRAPARIFAQALDPGLALWGRPPSSSSVLTTAGGESTGVVCGSQHTQLRAGPQDGGPPQSACPDLRASARPGLGALGQASIQLPRPHNSRGRKHGRSVPLPAYTAPQGAEQRSNRPIRSCATSSLDA